MDKYINSIKRFINKHINKQNTKDFLLAHKNTLIVIVAIILLGGITTIISYAYFTIIANQSIVGGQVGNIKNVNIYVYVEDKNASTGAGLGTYSRSVYIPQYTYTYNSSLSYCKRGSTLTYLNGKFTVSNPKDACYVYFDVSEAKNADIVLNIYVQKNGEYKLVNEIPSGTFALNNSSSCTNGATMTYSNRQITVNTTNKTVCNAYLDGQIVQPGRITQTVYRTSSPILANYGSSAELDYPSSISGLTLNTDYYNSPESSWNYYLKHEVDGLGNIINTYACFKDNNTQYCIQGGDSSYYSTGKDLLLNTNFNSYTCTDYTTYVYCSGSVNIYIESSGIVRIDNYAGGNCNNTVPTAAIDNTGYSAFINLTASACVMQ